VKLHLAPGSCALGIHVLLEEVGASYTLAPLDLRTGDQRKPAYLAVNPKGKVPALELDDGQILTEFQAIAFWLARTHPEARLLPADPLGQSRVLEMLDYIVGTVHMRGFVLATMPRKFCADPEGQRQMSEAGTTIVKEGIEALALAIGDGDWLLGDFSIADAAAFYLLRWIFERGGPVTVPLPLARYFDRLLARPAVCTAMDMEGLRP